MTDDVRHDDPQHTGTGAPRSADQGSVPASDADPIDPNADPAVVTGATTGSHPSATDEVDINRSGSGGTGGPSAD